MPRILSSAIGFPPYFYTQEEISSSLQEIWSRAGMNADRVAHIHRATTVEGRHIAVAKEGYYDLRGWEAPNGIFAEQAVLVGEETLGRLFEGSGLGPEDVRLIAFASTTGLAIPTIDARLMNRLPFRADTKRLPLFGLGCVAGASGTARVADYLRGYPEEAAVLLCEEFCSLTIQKQDLSIANVIACGLFGDAAGALLMVGDEHPLAEQAGPSVVASRSVFFPDSEGYMGWHIREAGMELILSAEVPGAVRTSLREPVEALLGEHDLTLEDVTHWVCHPGGPKVIEAVESALHLNGRTLHHSRDVLREIGNVSSVSVLVILDRVLRQDRPSPGSYGLMMAMGPGFMAEIVLLKW
jgi:alkylresorcinol/alkylpyrone synthase